MNDQHLELLIRSFEEQLNEQEQKELDGALAESQDLKAYQKNLIQMRDTLASLDYNFSGDFDQQISAKLESTMANSDIVRLSKWLTIPAAAAILALLAVNFYDYGSLSLNSILGLETVSENLITFTIVGH